jgi:hypothetical protein
MATVIIKHQRRYPQANWDYKAISMKINDKGIVREIVYSVANGIYSVEMYTGINYIVGVKNPSRSRRYSLDNVPKKYESVVSVLKNEFDNAQWSDEKYVNLN